MPPDVVNRLIERFGERALRLPVWAHASARPRLRASERRPRHAGYPGLARPSLDPGAVEEVYNGGL